MTFLNMRISQVLMTLSFSKMERDRLNKDLGRMPHIWGTCPIRPLVVAKLTGIFFSQFRRDYS